MSDTTIVNLKTTRLSIPWRDGPPAPVMERRV